MSGGGGGEKKQETTSTVQPYGPARPMIDQSLKAAQNLYQSGALYQTPYMGDTVADASPEQQQAWGQIAGIAGQGSPLVGASSNYLQSVMDPSFLSQQTPGLEQILNDVQGRATGAAMMGGRLGSGAHARGVASGVAPYLFQDYARRQGLQMQAAGMAPGIDQAQYYGANQLNQVGQQRQGQLQDEINAQIQQYNAFQNAPMAELSNYQNLLGFASPYGQTSQVAPKQNQGGNPWLTGLGAVAGIGSMFF